MARFQNCRAIAFLLGILVLVFYFFAYSSNNGAKPNKAAKSTETDTCEWSFERYEESEYEKKWMSLTKANPTGKGFCGDLHSAKHAAETYELASVTVAINANERPDPKKFGLFSTMVYKGVCRDGSKKVNII
jgi:hypothetical protein